MSAKAGQLHAIWRAEALAVLGGETGLRQYVRGALAHRRRPGDGWGLAERGRGPRRPLAFPQLNSDQLATAITRPHDHFTITL